MAVKVKKKFEKTRQVKNIDGSKKHSLQGQRLVRYHDRLLSSKKKSYNITYIFFKFHPIL